MKIDFNAIDSMTFPGMNNGTGTMSARMYNDDSYRIIPTAIHPGGSIGNHKDEYGIDTFRTTIKTDIEVLQQAGYTIEATQSFFGNREDTIAEQ